MALELEAGAARPADAPASAVRLSAWRLAIFSTPCIPLAAMLMPVTAYLPNYYATDLGVRQADLAWAFMAVRFFDLWFDPALGLLMDRTNSRWGRFRVWFVAGAPIAMLAVFMLFMAQPGITGAYILIWLIVGFAGQSMGQLAHMAWGAMIAPAYEDRSRVYGWWQTMSATGMIVILLLPPLVKYGFGGTFTDGIQAMGWFAMLILPVTAVLALAIMPEPPVKPHHEPPRLSHFWALLKRPTVLRLLGADILWGTGLALAGTLLFFYFDAVKGIDRGLAGLALILYFLGALVGAPLWTRLANRLGKHRALTIGGVAWALAQLSVLIAPPSVIFLFCAMFVAGLPFAAGPVLLKAMMADVGDEERLSSGVDRTGLLFSLLTGSVKIGSMLAVGGSLYALDRVGFEPTRGAANAEAALTTLSAMFIFGPALLALGAAGLIHGYRLDAAAHAEVRRRLEDRDRGAG